MLSEIAVPIGRIDPGANGRVVLTSRRHALFWLACAFAMLSSVLLMARDMPGRRAPASRSVAEQFALTRSNPPPAFPMVKAGGEKHVEQSDQIPVDRSALMVAAPYISRLTGIDRLRARDCLALAGWYEAGGDAKGQEAIMQVVLNRVRHPSFPHSVCGVVFEGAERTTGCQFTFTCDGSLVLRRPSEPSLAAARRRADHMLNGNVLPDVGTATHYHADYVLPYWAHQLTKIAVVDGQSFYRWPGYWGDRAAMVMQSARQEPVEPAISWVRSDPVAISTPTLPVVTTKIALTDMPDDLSPAKETNGPQTSGISIHSIVLESTAPPGRFAIDALESCKNRPSCLVAGWAGRKATSGITSEQLLVDRPDFLFLKRDRTGISSAYWNCAKYKRADSAHCLPTSAAGIGALLTTGGWSA